MDFLWVACGIPMISYGFHMDFLWNSFGFHMEVVGFPMEFPRCPVDFLWISYVLWISYECSYGCPMEFLFGFSIDFLQVSYGILVISYGFPMGLIWNSYDFLLNSYGIPVISYGIPMISYRIPLWISYRFSLDVLWNSQ